MGVNCYEKNKDSFYLEGIIRSKGNINRSNLIPNYNEKKINLSVEEENFDFKTKYLIQYDSVELENNLEEFSKDFIIQDSFFEKEHSEDEIYNLLKKKEKVILTQFLNDKKPELLNFLKNKIDNNNNDNFNYNDIVKKIIVYEEANIIYQKKIMKEILKIKKNKKEFKIKYLTIILVGKSGVGKSTLINNLLKLNRKEKAKTGTGDFVTTKIESYQSNSVPFLKLVDTRGIELNVGFGAEDVKKIAVDYITEQNKYNDSNNFVQCIWYCITGTRMEQAEINLLNSLRRAYGESQIPIIIVYTQATDEKLFNQMKKYIRSKNINGDLIQVLAERKELVDDTYMEPFGLDKLVEITIEKCKKAFNGKMAKVMTKNLSNNIFEKLKNENKYIKNYIYERCIKDFISKYIVKKDNKGFIKYIINIFGLNIQYFLTLGKELRKINNLSYNCYNNSYLIKTRTNQYIKDYHDFTKKIISPNLNIFAIEFLDEQVAIQLDNNKEIEIDNKRSLQGFIDSTNTFLSDNFYYISQVIYLEFIIKSRMKNLSDCFETQLNELVIDNLNKNKNIIDLITQCFSKKFEEFEKNVNKHLTQNNIHASSNNYDESHNNSNNIHTSNYNNNNVYAHSTNIGNSANRDLEENSLPTRSQIKENNDAPPTMQSK